MKSRQCFSSLVVLQIILCFGRALSADWAVYPPADGLGKGKHIVFLTGDEEYRSEEGLPMLAKILAVHHGFKCTVLFSINSADGTIDPGIKTNIPGIKALATADLCLMGLRFRNLPDSQMKYFVNYLKAGKPIVAMRTSTHAFAYGRDSESPYATYDWQSKQWPGGFGQQVLGETWVSHHGAHGKESTRGLINEELKDHPILRGVRDIWGPTDVYTVTHLPKDASVLLWGQVLSGMNLDDPPVEGPKNHPLMPLVWVRNFVTESGTSSKIVATTMGAAEDLQNEGLRRLLINSCYWACGMEKQISPTANVQYVGEYHPTAFGFGKHKRGMKPADLELKE